MPAIILPAFADGEVLGYDRVSQLWAAINDLANPPSAIYDKNTADPNLTTTSTTFVDMDATVGKFNLTIPVKGNPVLVGFNGTFTHGTAGSYMYLDLLINGTLRSGGGASGLGLYLHQFAVTTDYWSFSFAYLVSGLSAGNNTFKLNWRTSAGTVSLQSGVKPQFFVREL